ncbi:abortive infection family protein [Kibdelosporangium aridum]|uniref:abortive infection family protein n=1 Tax=Kibdelosporangium aridum TaxID=2030 RepID=UPI00389951F6
MASRVSGPVVAGRVRAIVDDPAQAIGTGRSTAKLCSSKETVPSTIGPSRPGAGAQEALGLHPSSTTPGGDGSGAVEKILGAVTTIVTALGELRNRSYGTGHGATTAPVRLRLDTHTCPSMPQSPRPNSSSTPSPIPTRPGARTPHHHTATHHGWRSPPPTEAYQTSTVACSDLQKGLPLTT